MNTNPSNSNNNRSYRPAFHSRVNHIRSQDSNAPTATTYPNAFQQTRRPRDSEESSTRNEGRFEVFGGRPRNQQQHPRGQHEYRSWKNKEEPVMNGKPKEINLSSTEDFPTLGAAVALPVKPVPAQSSSLAEKLKVVIQQEQEEATQRRYVKDTAREEMQVIPLSIAGSFMRRQAEKRREAEEERQRAIDEYDNVYQADTLEDENKSCNDNNDEDNEEYEEENDA